MYLGKNVLMDQFHLPQHFLNFKPLPQGQGSFRPTFILRSPVYREMVFCSSNICVRLHFCARSRKLESACLKNILYDLQNLLMDPSCGLRMRFFVQPPRQYLNHLQFLQAVGNVAFIRPNEYCRSEFSISVKLPSMIFPSFHSGSTKKSHE